VTMRIANIHCHILYGVDDGARDGRMMSRMIDSAYRSGVRIICATPHHNPEYFRCPPRIIVERYGEVVSYVTENYHDMIVLLGQEIYCRHDSVNELLAGKCLSLNRTRNVLVEFGTHADKSEIISGASRFLTSGFVPLIAHAERYDAIRNNKNIINDLRGIGAKIQINASSVIGNRGFLTKRFVMSLIKSGIVDVVADDCHDMNARRPCIGEAYSLVSHKFGAETANELFWENPLRMIGM